MFLQARCPACHPRYSVKAVKETKALIQFSGPTLSLLHPSLEGASLTKGIQQNCSSASLTENSLVTDGTF